MARLARRNEFFFQNHTKMIYFPTVPPYKATSSTYKTEEGAEKEYEKLWSNVKNENLLDGNTILHFSSFDHR